MCVFQSYLGLPIQSKGQKSSENVNFLFQQSGGNRRAVQTPGYARSAHKTLCVFTVCAPICAARDQKHAVRGLEVCLPAAREGMSAARVVANFLAHRFLTLFRPFCLQIPKSFHEIDCRHSIAPLNPETTQKPTKNH